MSTWYEIVVEGSEGSLRAFLAGYEAGVGAHSNAILGVDLGIEHTLAERLRELFKPGAHHLFVAPENAAKTLIAAIRATGPEVDLAIQEVRAITSASVGFTAEAYSTEVAARIKQLMLSDLPEGVELHDLEEAESHDEDGHGTELYAPVHHFTYRSSGSFSGPLPGVLEMRRRAVDAEFVTPGEVTLTTSAIKE